VDLDFEVSQSSEICFASDREGITREREDQSDVPSIPILVCPALGCR
jgi:hypothetical protein